MFLQDGEMIINSSSSLLVLNKIAKTYSQTSLKLSEKVSHVYILRIPSLEQYLLNSVGSLTTEHSCCIELYCVRWAI